MSLLYILIYIGNAVYEKYMCLSRDQLSSQPIYTIVVSDRGVPAN